jgi:uncharacterized protein (TIGR02266 family)
MNQRAHPRNPAILSVAYGDANALRTDYAQNISRGGLFLATAAELVIGDHVALRLSVAGHGGVLTIPAEVRWIGTAGEPAVPGVGVSFDRSDAVLGARIDRLIERLETPPDAPVRVLLVEPNPHAARLFSDGLRAEARRHFGDGHPISVVEVHDGRAALEALRETLFDLAIVELRTPEIDGETLIERVRAELDPGLPIIAVATPDGHRREVALRAGADAFLAKPVQLRTLANSIRLLLG